MSTIQVDVVSAEESIFSGEARFVALPGEAGELGRIALKRADLFRQQCYVDGKWTGEPTVDVRNPATRGVIGRIPNLGKAETERAVAAASAALPTSIATCSCSVVVMALSRVERIWAIFFCSVSGGRFTGYS